MYIPLHVHSDYSLLDSTIKVKDLVKKAKSFGMHAVAITDHGNMFAAVELAQEAGKSGIKPIIGCEVYVANNRHVDDGHDADEEAPGHNKKVKNNHLVLLAKNETGYKNLVSIVSDAYQNGFKRKPRTDMDFVGANASGLIALSACLGGEISQAILQGDISNAERIAARHHEMFGRGNYYIELQHNGIKIQPAVNKELLRIAKKLSIPVVGTNDCHYLEPGDHLAHEVLLCLKTGATLNNPNRYRFDTTEVYFKSPAEMQEYFAEVPEALSNTLQIAEQCVFKFNADFKMPDFHVPGGIPADDHIASIAREGLKRKFSGNPPVHYVQRLENELKMIAKMGFSGYLLIVYDFINAAKTMSVPVGPGRGSAAGSLVAYSLGITNIDPIKYGLLFERFLNPERVSMPDIDVDFCRDKRQMVIDYVQQKYSSDHVSQIITFGTMAARAAIRDVGRVMGIPLPEVDRVAKLIPTELKITIEKALKGEPKLAELYERDEKIRNMIDIAKKLEGNHRHASRHAAGVVIAPSAITDYCPLYLANDKGSKSGAGDKGVFVTQFDMVGLEKIGLLKFDFLGLKTLTVIEKSLEFLKKRGVELDILNIPVDDKKTFALLQKADVTSVFQLESSGMRKLLQQIQPDCFEDLIALVALFRPGPLGSGMVTDFVNRKNGTQQISYQWPEMAEALDSILRETYGIVIYQEQVMQIAERIAGFTLAQADLLRRAMGKKKPEEMEAQKVIFVEGAVKNGYSKIASIELFDLLAKFAEYGFNKSHSAAYAFIAYQTAYLKAHFPVEFMAANLSAEMGVADKMFQLINDCRNSGIKLLPPDINQSEDGFTIVPEGIRMGLSAIKMVGDAIVTSIIEDRKKNGPYRSFLGFMARIKKTPGVRVNKRSLENMICAGVFDSLYENHSPYQARPLALFNLAEVGVTAKQKTTKQHKKTKAQQPDLLTADTQYFDFEHDGPKAPDNHEVTGGDGVAPWDTARLLSAEKDVIGFYITGHPVIDERKHLDQYGIQKIESILEILDIDEASEVDPQRVTFAGVITDIDVKTKADKKTQYAIITVEDESGSISVMVGGKLFSAAGHSLQKNAIIVADVEIKGYNGAVSKFVQRIRGIHDLMPDEMLVRFETKGFAIKQVTQNSFEAMIDAAEEANLVRWIKFLKPCLAGNVYGRGHDKVPEAAIKCTLQNMMLADCRGDIEIAGKLCKVPELKMAIQHLNADMQGSSEVVPEVSDDAAHEFEDELEPVVSCYDLL